MSEYIKVCKLSQIPEGNKGTKFTINDNEFVIFKIKNNVYAVENTCPHNHTHQLHEGFVDEEFNIECPVHGWKFNLETGKPPKKIPGASAKLQILPVKIENNIVYIKFEEKSFKFNF